MRPELEAYIRRVMDRARGTELERLKRMARDLSPELTPAGFRLVNGQTLQEALDAAATMRAVHDEAMGELDRLLRGFA